MELADAGDIQKKINHHISGNTHFNEAELWQALIQMTRGLKALH
jgi:NIMA (never in mitosis gene a)-related kinase